MWTGLEVFAVHQRYLPYCEVHTERNLLDLLDVYCVSR